MVTIRITTKIHAPIGEVWDIVEDIGDHVNWMKDAEQIRFIGSQRSGVGTQFDCDTKVGPIRLTDRMEIVEWVTGELIGVSHEGLVKGEGKFTLTSDTSDSTLFTWEETLYFPFWMGGPLRNPVGGRILSSIWRKNLESLKAKIEKNVR